jgi:MFS family permease
MPSPSGGISSPGPNCTRETPGHTTDERRLASAVSASRECPPVTRPAAVPGKRFRAGGLSRRSAFWLIGAVFFLLLFGAGAPAPLYGVYKAQWQFSVTTLTAVFAAYAIALLVTLLMFGSVSDGLGRRGTIIAGLAVNALACAVFLAARDVGALFVARAVQGLAVGLATGALGAALLDLQPDGSGLAPRVSTSAPPLGLAAGALATSALVQYGPARTHLVWWLLLGASLAAIVAVLGTPESGSGRRGVLASLRPHVGVPREALGAFAVALPCLFAVWALSGFYLSLGPSLAAQLLRSQNLLWGGVMVALLFAVGVPVTFIARRSSFPNVMLGGCVALITGAAITFVAIATRTSAALLAGAAVAGLGWGPAFMGAYGTIVALARADQRAGLVAAIYTVGYLAFSIPALIAGVATSHYGLHQTALVYVAVVGVLAATAAGLLLLRRAHGRRGSQRATSHAEPPPASSAAPPNRDGTAPAQSSG